jgi:uncharacterized DUF497 family protein
LPLLPISGTNLCVHYEWDNGKAALNLRKHGVDFADAVAALEDTNRVEELDVRFVYGEERTQVIGVAHGTRAIRDRDATRRRHLQNHIGPEGHMT